jgi:DNA processing protein
MTQGILRGPRSELSIDDSAFPAPLREIAKPPHRLYVVGNVDALRPGLAVVGARKATPYGRGCARRFARIAAEKGVCIISGGARGCDSEAHRSALAAGGPTVVFLGGGCDCLYPPEHFELFQSIVDAGGAIVSERAWGFKPMPYTFRERNRLIAGLAEAVLIVEAGLPSGTFSTADEALASGKEVLVVPGAITSESSHGSNRLLYQGAIPVVDDESFEDILFSVMGMLKRPMSNSMLSPGQREGALQNPTQKDDALVSIDNPIVAALRASPLGMEPLYQIAVKSYGSDVAFERLMETIAEAEAAGLIARQPDGTWGPVVKP